MASLCSLRSRCAAEVALATIAAVDTTMLPEGGTSVGATYVATSDEALQNKMTKGIHTGLQMLQENCRTGYL